MMCQENDIGLSLLVVVYCVHYASTSELFKRRLGGRLVIPKGFSIVIILIVTGIMMAYKT